MLVMSIILHPKGTIAISVATKHWTFIKLQIHYIIHCNSIASWNIQSRITGNKQLWRTSRLNINLHPIK